MRIEVYPVQYQWSLPAIRTPKLVSPPQRGTLRAGYFSGLNNLVREMGGNPIAILEKHSLDPHIFSNPDNTMPCSAAVNLLEYCSESLNDPLFGLHLAVRQQPEVLGCSVALAQSAPTLRDAIQCLVDFISVSASPESEMELVRSSNTAELRWHSNVGFGDEVQTNYQGLLLQLKTLRMLCRQNLRPLYATVRCHIDMSHVEALQSHLGCKIHGKSRHSAIAFPMELLDRPLETSNHLLFSILSEGLAHLRSSAHGDFAEQVGAVVRQMLTTGQCSIEACASDLHISVRTLQKRLKLRGLTFSDVVQKERIELAKHALQWSNHSIDKISFELGYAEQTSFGRAFKRVTGQTPKNFRFLMNSKR